MGKVIAIDFLNFILDLIKFNSIMLFTNCCTSYVFDIYFNYRSSLIVKKGLNRFIVIIIQ